MWLSRDGKHFTMLNCFYSIPAMGARVIFL